MAPSLARNAGARERLKVRTRCGWSSCAAQIRCTERSETPAAAAMARPVQWVASPGGSAQVIATIRRTASAQRRFAGLPGLVVQEPVHAFLGVPPPPAPD